MSSSTWSLGQKLTLVTNQQASVYSSVNMLVCLRCAYMYLGDESIDIILYHQLCTTTYSYSNHTPPPPTHTQADTARFHINPLSDGCTRSLISPLHIEGMISGVISRTMVNKSHGPLITVQRLAQEWASTWNIKVVLWSVWASMCF